MPHMNGDYLVVPAGILDSDLTLTPDAHVFLGSRSSWDSELAAIPGFDAFPS
jgi:hypothetical protein